MRTLFFMPIVQGSTSLFQYKPHFISTLAVMSCESIAFSHVWILCVQIITGVDPHEHRQRKDTLATQTQNKHCFHVMSSPKWYQNEVQAPLRSKISMFVTTLRNMYRLFIGCYIVIFCIILSYYSFCLQIHTQ